MTCQRCDGLMVRERYDDLELGSAGYEISGWRCLNCGAVLDPVIAGNRRTRIQSSVSSQPVITRTMDAAVACRIG